MHRTWWTWVIGLTVVLVPLGGTVGPSSAGRSDPAISPTAGFDSSFCVPRSGNVPAAADLTNLETMYVNASELVVTATAAGPIPSPSRSYSYGFLVGNRSLEGGATAEVGNQSTAVVTYFEPSGDLTLRMPYAVGGRTLTLVFNASRLGPSARFTANAEGFYNASTPLYSFIGSNYNQSGIESCAGGGSIPVGGGSSPGSPNRSGPPLGWASIQRFAFAGALIGALVVATVIALVRHGHRPPSSPRGPG